MAEVAGFQGVRSGELEVAFEIDRYMPGRPEEVNMRIVGNFMGMGEGKMPQMDMGIESRGPLGGREIEFSGGLTLLNDRIVLTYGPPGIATTYRPGSARFEKLKSKFEEAQGEEGAGNAGACVEAAGDFNLSEVLSHVHFEGDNSYKGLTQLPDGTNAYAVTAQLDLPAAFQEVVKLTEDPACNAQLEALGLPSVPQLEELEKQVEGSKATALLNIDKHGVIRYLETRVNVELPHNEELEVELIIRLNEVNEITRLPHPKGYTPFPVLLKKFGVDTQTLEEANFEEIFLAFLEANADALFGRGKP
ncbi:MAG: hypothetical protein ACTHLH_12755 [Solirubrobacterales bacterium]